MSLSELSIKDSLSSGNLVPMHTPQRRQCCQCYTEPSIHAIAMHNYQNKMLPFAAASTTSHSLFKYPQVFPLTLPSQFRHSQLQPPVPPSIPPAFGSNVPPAFPPPGKFNLLGAGLI